MVGLKDIVNKGITPVLRQAGFKRNGQNFHRKVGEVDWCINIQKYRRISDKGSNSLLFTVNAGVTFEEYHEVFYSTQGVPTENCCPLRARPGQFIWNGNPWFSFRMLLYSIGSRSGFKGREDWWFMLCPHKNPKYLLSAVNLLLSKGILPEMQRFKTKMDLLGYIENGKTRPFDVRPRNIVRLVLLKSVGMRKEADVLEAELNQNPRNENIVRRINAVL